MNKSSDQILYAMNLAKCPEGRVLDCPANEPDQRLEQLFFPGLTNALTHCRKWPSGFAVVSDLDIDNSNVLEHRVYKDAFLVSETDFWQDLTILVSIRQLDHAAQPTGDREFNTDGLCGILLRFQDLRHFILLCLRNGNQVVLYERDDERWTILACQNITPSTNPYLELAIRTEGNRIQCSVNHSIFSDLYLDAVTVGRFGLYANTVCRFRDWTVFAAPLEITRHDCFLAARSEQAEIRAARVPAPVVRYRLDISDYAPTAFRFGRFGSISEKDLLLIRSAGYHLLELTAISLTGHVFWKRSFDSDYNWRDVDAVLPMPLIHDFDVDGIDDIVCVYEGKIARLDGRTGKDLVVKPLFPSGPFTGLPGDPAEPDMDFYLADLRGIGHRTDIVIRDGDSGGGHMVWALDSELNLLWQYQQRQPMHGHHFSLADIDDDGRDEVLAGFTLLDHDGSEIWRVENCERGYRFAYARHVDSAIIGDLDGDTNHGLEAALVAGAEGYMLVEARTGHIKRHHLVGHAQAVSVGRFRPDLPGVQMWVGTRWGNFGIMTLFDGKGDLLCRMQPDFVAQGGPPVNWSGNGEEFLLLQTPTAAFGLYDGNGLRLPLLDQVIVPDQWNQWLALDVCGDQRDEIIIGNNREIIVITQSEIEPGQVFAADSSEPGSSSASRVPEAVPGSSHYLPFRVQEQDVPYASWPNSNSQKQTGR